MKKLTLLILTCSAPAWLCAQPAAPAAKESVAAEISTGSVKAAAKPAKPGAAAKKKRPAAARTKPAAQPIPVGPGNPAKEGDRLVLPKEDPASQLLSGEFVAAAGLPREGLESGGFVVGKMYTVVKGDTLWDLSGKYYKNPFLWGKIYNANFKTVANPDLINPDDQLIIPDYDEIVIPYRRIEAAAAGAGTSAVGDTEFGEYAGPPAGQGAAVPAGKAGPPAPAGKAGLPAPGEILKDFDRNFLSEEMPEDQKEWSDGMKVVPDSWSEDGVISAKLASNSGSMDESFSLSGEEVEIVLSGSVRVRPGDYLAIYLKGGDAYAKSGKRLGRELQPAGLAEVVSVDGSLVRARVIDATTAISKGYIVKKK